MERVPFLATAAAARYAGLGRLPVTVLLDNVRSMYNVGSFFRTADAAGIERLCLCGITAHPPKPGVAKTALGAEQTVAWEYAWDPLPVAERLRSEGHELAAVETAPHAIDLFEWQPSFPVCVIFGHEVEGIRGELRERCDLFVQIPMLGKKHSLNVATAGGVVLYELLRKYTRAQLRGGGRR